MLDLPGDTAGISDIKIQDGLGSTVLHKLSNRDAPGVLTEIIRRTKQHIDTSGIETLYGNGIEEGIHAYIENAGPIYPEDEEEYMGLCRKYMGGHAHVQMSDEAERELFRQYNSSNNQEYKKKIRDEILRLYYPLIIAIAQKYKTEYLRTEDLVSIGVIEVIENLPTKKFHYQGFGYRCAKWALTGIKKYIEEHDGIVHIPPLQREIGERIQGILYIRDGVRRGESPETVRANMERHVGLGEVNISLWKERGELLWELRSTRIEMACNMTGITENDMVIHDPEAESLDMKKLTWELLKSLSELEKKVLIERFYHDKSFEEIGNICEITSKDVQKIIGKIRVKLGKNKQIFHKFEDLFGPKWSWTDYIKSL